MSSPKKWLYRSIPLRNSSCMVTDLVKLIKEVQYE